jgi:NAD(P)-dependent dehydrogenase (short-subunit alcohol dehydrogenase family)
VNLTGKVAIVTGAARGIGAACSARLAGQGAAVVCVDVLSDQLGEKVEAISAAGSQAIAVTADVATAEGNELAVEAAIESYGGLDIFHANAAVQHIGRIDAASLDAWDQMQQVNLRGAYLGARAAIPRLRDRGGGCVIFTASLLGLVGDPDMPAYGAMKGGLIALCRSLAAAHGPENIRVNTVCPGDVETEMVSEFFAFQPDPEAARRAITERYPLRRFARPVDVAAAVAFLASDDAGYITGIDLVVDGGLLARIY